jgi:hypothetical protein
MAALRSVAPDLLWQIGALLKRAISVSEYIYQDPLCREAIQAALNSVSMLPGIARKLEWWLVSPHAAERWLQFELAYALNEVFSGQYLVACEIRVGKELADLAIFKAAAGPSPVWEGTPIALIELKMFGNWHVRRGQIDEFRNDRLKVDTYPCPSLAVACCVEVRGTSKGDLYDWCFNQIKKLGKDSYEEMRAELAKDNPGPVDHLAESEIPSGELRGFSSMRLHMCAYCNNRR